MDFLRAVLSRCKNSGFFFLQTDAAGVTRTAGGKLRRRGGISVWSPGASESFGQEIISEEDIHAGIVLPESKAPEIGGTSSSWHRL